MTIMSAVLQGVTILVVILGVAPFLSALNSFVSKKVVEDKAPAPDPTKLCVDCDHLKESNMYMYCIKSGVTSLVTGRLENLKYCDDCRADETSCGPSGKFYSGENKIKERLSE